MRLLDGGLELTERQRLVRGSIRDVCADFDDDYWRERAREGEYPHAFLDRLADDGWLDILVPERYGGAGMETRADRTDDGWVVNGTKVWTSRLDVSDYAVLVARTTPREAVEKRTHGISMFLVDVADAVESGASPTSPSRRASPSSSTPTPSTLTTCTCPSRRSSGLRARGSTRCSTG
jgi:alkylation response protein AidB-like acyl-CoA dehydrogenase